MLTSWYSLVAGTILLGLITVNAIASNNVLGYVEFIYLQPGHIKLKAKLDTGARTSSIYAVDIEPFKKDDEEWVAFTMPFDQVPDVDAITIEKKITRKVLIKHRNRESIPRYVVEFDICLDGRMIRSEFTLANRKNFLYAVLLGRNTLRGNAIVDPAGTFFSNRECPAPETLAPENNQ